MGLNFTGSPLESDSRYLAHCCVFLGADGHDPSLGVPRLVRLMTQARLATVSLQV